MQDKVNSDESAPALHGKQAMQLALMSAAYLTSILQLYMQMRHSKCIASF